MLKMITLFAAVMMFATPALAGSCPAKIAAIDAALASGKAKNAEAVKKMRDEGEALHKSGGHAASVKILKEAMALAGI